MPTRRWLLTFGAAVLVLPRRGARAEEPQRWMCTYNECDPYVYDPVVGDPDNIAGEHPIPPGVRFEDLPEDWLCPVCGAPKDYFVKTERRWSPS